MIGGISLFYKQRKEKCSIVTRFDLHPFWNGVHTGLYYAALGPFGFKNKQYYILLDVNILKINFGDYTYITDTIIFLQGPLDHNISVIAKKLKVSSFGTDLFDAEESIKEAVELYFKDIENVQEHLKKIGLKIHIELNK